MQKVGAFEDCLKLKLKSITYAFGFLKIVDVNIFLKRHFASLSSSFWFAELDIDDHLLVHVGVADDVAELLEVNLSVFVLRRRRKTKFSSNQFQTKIQM